jgi:CheY-like chemotaxis protein
LSEIAERRQTILLVEDDELIRANTAEMLKELGHVIIEVGSAEEAIPVLESTPIDTLITDVSLPGMSGDKLAAKARDMRPGIRIVFATGKADKDEIPGHADATLLRKPYGQAGLAAALT